jgi:hypothetical protein
MSLDSPPRAHAAPPSRPGLVVSPLATDAGCIIQSSLGTESGNPGNLEIVVLEGNQLVHYWHPNSEAKLAWRRSQVITKTATGPGCLIQSSFGTEAGKPGNLEVVVPEGNQLVHYWHDSSAPNSPWHHGLVFGSGVRGRPSFIQSSLKTPGSVHGSFEVVVREGSDLVHYWHDSSQPTKPWVRGQTIATTATGGGSIIQSSFKPMPTAPGNFEVVFQEGSSVTHYWHDNTNPNNPWVRGPTFASGVTGQPDLIQSSFGAEPGNAGNFEVAVRQGNDLVHWYRNNNEANPWSQGQVIASGINSAGSLIQSTIGAGPGSHGNFELVVLGEAAAAPPDSQVEGGFTDYNLVHYYHVNSSPTNSWVRGQDVTFRGRSEKVCQLTGHIDRETFVLTTNDTADRFDLGFTDLGYPVDDGSTLKLYFGDSRNKFNQGLPSEWSWDDTVGISTDTAPPTPINCLHISVPQAGGTTAKLVIDQLPEPPNPRLFQGLFNVPSSGFTVGSTAYTIFWTNHCTFLPRAPCPDRARTLDYVDKFGRGTLTRNTGNTTFQEFLSLPPQFTYTASLNSDNVAGIPANQQLGVYVWGVSLYRESYPTLAYVPSGQVENPGAWRYFMGLDTDENPIWSPDPAQARPAFNTGDPPGTGCIGEFSVSWVAPLQRWAMLYNCGATVRARFATTPWGPWSAPTEIFEPGIDKAYCRYMHAVNISNISKCIDHAGGDNVDATGADAAGSPYAPYVLSRFTDATPQGAEIYFLMSTWNPYQTVIMRANLTLSP